MAVPAALLKEIRALVAAAGEVRAATALGVSLNTLSRVLAGLTVRKKTLALLKERLSSNKQS